MQSTEHRAKNLSSTSPGQREWERGGKRKANKLQIQATPEMQIPKVCYALPTNVHSVVLQEREVGRALPCLSHNHWRRRSEAGLSQGQHTQGKGPRQALWFHLPSPPPCPLRLITRVVSGWLAGKVLFLPSLPFPANGSFPTPQSTAVYWQVVVIIIPDNYEGFWTWGLNLGRDQWSFRLQDSSGAGQKDSEAEGVLSRDLLAPTAPSRTKTMAVGGERGANQFPQFYPLLLCQSCRGESVPKMPLKQWGFSLVFVFSNYLFFSITAEFSIVLVSNVQHSG